MKKMCTAHMIAFVLVIIGAINWGLVGAFGFNLVTFLFGSWPTVERIIYVVVGLAGLFMIPVGSCKACKACQAPAAPKM